MKHLILIALLPALATPLQASAWSSSLSGGRGEVSIDDNNRQFWSEIVDGGNQPIDDFTVPDLDQHAVA